MVMERGNETVCINTTGLFACLGVPLGFAIGSFVSD